MAVYGDFFDADFGVTTTSLLFEAMALRHLGRPVGPIYDAHQEAMAERHCRAGRSRGAGHFAYYG